jgi:3-methyladenine DNA glycosylase AlkC
MNPEECYNALKYLIEEYVDSSDKKNEILNALSEDQKRLEIPPAKHYLSELNKYNKVKQVTEKDSKLIKDIAFYYI